MSSIQITLLDWTPIFESHMTRLVVKNGLPKEMCHDEIGLCAKSIDNILCLILNIIGRAYEIV